MASAAKDLRYNHRNAVYGSLAYDLDRELRERELGHAGEAPLQRGVALERPKVRSVSKVLYTDTSGTCASDENCLTLYTCVMDQPSYRWMVRAAAQ